VEAAVLIPVLMLLILLLTQPLIMLYTHMVMQSAAAEACRLMATSTEQGPYSADKYEGYVKRRLAAIPPIDIFHAHTGAKPWDIQLQGSEATQEVSVRITNKLRPLPLLSWGFGILGQQDAQGYVTQTVEATMPTQPAWVWSATPATPREWVESWQ
jgi:hypothetical protein